MAKFDVGEAVDAIAKQRPSPKPKQSLKSAWQEKDKALDAEPIVEGNETPAGLKARWKAYQQRQRVRVGDSGYKAKK